MIDEKHSDERHVMLWHRKFWLILTADFLMSMAVTVLIPTLPVWAGDAFHGQPGAIGWLMAAFAVGMFLPGCFCSYLVHHFHRSRTFVVCMLVLALSMIWPLLLAKPLLWQAVLWRLVQGVAFGLGQMVLLSTLLVDVSESHKRTEANYSAAWFGRFALSLGPLTALLINQTAHSSGQLMQTTLSMAAACGVISLILVLLTRIPFRIPDDSVHLFSLDRFFLPSGFPLFVNLLLSSIPIGLLLSLPLSAHDYGMMMVGFLLAILAQRFVFREAELMSEIITGLVLVDAVFGILLAGHPSPLTTPLFGLGIGLIGSRFLLLFIKLSSHCQRGTSQSTFMLGWESGIYLGLAIGLGLLGGRYSDILLTGFACCTLSLICYATVIHRWFLAHKNR